MAGWHQIRLWVVQMPRCRDPTFVESCFHYSLNRCAGISGGVELAQWLVDGVTKNLSDMQLLVVPDFTNPFIRLPTTANQSVVRGVQTIMTEQGARMLLSFLKKAVLWLRPSVRQLKTYTTAY